MHPKTKRKWIIFTDSQGKYRIRLSEIAAVYHDWDESFGMFTNIVLKSGITLRLTSVDESIFQHLEEAEGN